MFGLRELPYLIRSDGLQPNTDTSHIILTWHPTQGCNVFMIPSVACKKEQVQLAWILGELWLAPSAMDVLLAMPVI